MKIVAWMKLPCETRLLSRCRPPMIAAQTNTLTQLVHTGEEHLASMDQLRQGIGLRAYAQKNPKQEYKRESFALFEDLLNNIKYETIRYLSHIEVATEDDMRRLEQQRRDEQKNREYQHAKAQGIASQDGREDESGVAIEGRKPVQRLGPKVGRNDPCTCGSGTKYKQCCGRIQ